ncbi:uncharacterized protein Ir60a [Chelonus insularis]|uniref:uncharacterized protein Ir60a n=1 Tax=Chelonus insularis TaxID=460826 RepID=UPI00158CBFC9|nr:uncharacterized protein LOC118063610 [Chelonus insularis]
MFIVDTNNNRNCAGVEFLLKQLKMTYLSEVYIFCMRNSTNVGIFTHDPYGNDKHPFWSKFETEMVFHNKWTLYGRFFRKASVCQNFLFDRAPLNGITVFIAGIKHTFDTKKIGLRTFHNNFTKDIADDKIQQFEIMKKLLNIKIIYYEWNYYPSRRTSGFLGENLMKKFPHIDVLHELHIYKVPSYSLQVSAPIKRVLLTIISQKRGYKTPSEKIMDFYGIWTLISLLTILTITFAVIWLKKNRNFSFASFEVIRLLINTEILIPINTLSLKIFFSVIFLYFMVLHATFSGNLAKFLTIPILQTNVEMVEDLLDPRISKIYHSGFNFESYPFGDILKNKSQKIAEYPCFDLVIHNPNVACITLSSFVETFYYNIMPSSTKEMMEKIYWTTSELEPMFSSILFRVKFPLVEQWNRAILKTMETRIFTRVVDKITQKNLNSLHKWQIKNEVNFRKIYFEDLKIPFLLWIGGTVFGLISFFFEIFIFRYQNRKILVKTVKIKNSEKKLREKRKRKILLKRMLKVNCL